MQPLGIIVERYPCRGNLCGALREETVETAFGPALVYRSSEPVFILWHGTDPRRHILPHRINHQANSAGDERSGVRELVGIHSTGS